MIHISQGTLKIVASHQKLGERQNRFLLELLEGTNPLNIRFGLLTSGCERIDFSYVSHQFVLPC